MLLFKHIILMTSGTKLSSIDALNALYHDMRQKQSDNANSQIRICIGGGCIASGSLEIKAAFEDALKSMDCDLFARTEVFRGSG